MNEILLEETVPGGGHASLIVKRGQVLRITDPRGGANGHCRATVGDDAAISRAAAPRPREFLADGIAVRAIATAVALSKPAVGL